VQFNDAKRERLAASGYPGAVPDAERDWLLVATGEAGGQANDLWGLFLAQRGHTGQLNDALHSYLIAAGYLGKALADLQFQFWADSAPLPGPIP
jgi:hypothetical protein